MGAWGYKALECDDGMDLVGFLSGYAKQHNDLRLSELISEMQEQNFFKDIKMEKRLFRKPIKLYIDSFYDNNVLALTEIFLLFKENKKLNFDDENLLNVKSFTADKESISFLYDYLIDIRNELTDTTSRHEVVELWKESEAWEEWKTHLQWLIQELELCS